MDTDWKSLNAFLEFMKAPLNDGRPFVLETRHAVSLHFDHFATQSFMSVSAPDRLALGYTRAMMGFLLLQPAPRCICMIGLGGGSLAKYCYRHLFEAEIIAVEISPEVIALRDVFRIPADDARFRVVRADGADYMREVGAPADVILLDAFVSKGIPRRCAQSAFFAACRRRLTETGVLAINVTDDDPALPIHIERLKSVFGSSYTVVRSGNDGNFIVFAWKSGDRLPSRRVLLERVLPLTWADDLGLSSTARRMKDGEHLDPKRLRWHARGMRTGK